jgi:uncharacterized protein (TIGR03083 family)
MDRIAIIRTEAQRFAEVLAAAAPDARCPTCPDWNASDLLWHLTEVHYFWAGVLSQDARTDADIATVEKAKPERPTDIADLLTLREQATTALLEQLDGLDDTEPRWSWLPTSISGGWSRWATGPASGRSLARSSNRRRRTE